jgi:carbon storage regulator
VLVLTRRRGEEIVIAGNIRLTVVAIHGSQVRIGVEAPRNVSVQREELCRRAEGRGPVAPRPAT